MFNFLSETDFYYFFYVYLYFYWLLIFPLYLRFDRKDKLIIPYKKAPRYNTERLLKYI